MVNPENPYIYDVNLSPIQQLVLGSIDGQDPNWKNVLSRKFVGLGKSMSREDALEEFEKDQYLGFLHNKSSRISLAFTFFSSGYYVSELIQEMEPNKYNELFGSLSTTLHKIGLEPDENFLRWQMSDFFGAGFYAYFLSSATRVAFIPFGLKEVFGYDSDWWDAKAEKATPIIAGVILTSYEVLQAAASHDSIDVKDLAAYLAGLGLYLGSEKIWKEYQIFKKQYGFKHKHGLKDREE